MAVWELAAWWVACVLITKADPGYILLSPRLVCLFYIATALSGSAAQRIIWL